ncbi:MAG: hypothetical protein ACI93P_000176 [bacterium]|jgi:hypothetical protein
MIKRFLKKILFLFIFPIILIYIPPSLLLFLTNENFYNIVDAIDEDKEVLIGYSYNESNYKHLKWKTIIKKEKKTIWALGSSRVLQFREELFNQDFYNAGYTINTTGDYLTFLKSIPNEKLPDVLIIGFDQFMFNENWTSSKKTKVKTYWEESFSFYPSVQTILNTYADLFSSIKSIDNNVKLKNTTYIGLKAYMDNMGFRKDGSMYYGNMIKRVINKDPTLKQHKFKDTKSRIIKGNRKFQFGNLVDETAISNIEKLLKYCNLNNIKVIGFLPPFANEVLTDMLESNNYDYLNFIHDKLDGSFKKYKHELWDFTNPTKFGSDNTEFLDGFHGGELTYLKMIKFMADNNSIIGNYIDHNKVNFNYSEYNNKFEIFN